MEQTLRTSLIGITISLSLLALTAQAQRPTFTAASVVNAGSLVSGPLAPGMVAAIMGSNLGDPVFYGNCMNVTPPLPTCSAVSVLVNGAAAPKIFDSASEVTFQVPFNISGSTATIQVTSTLSGQLLSSVAVAVPVAAVAPGLFSANGTGSGTGYYYDSGGLVAEYSQAVQLGDTVVLFATGFGATNPAVATGTLGPTPGAAAAATVTMTINNQSVPVTFAGLEPGSLQGALVGYDEVVFTVPSTLTVPSGQTSDAFPVVVTVGGVASQSVNLVVAAPAVSITSVSPSPVPLSASPQTVTFNGAGFESGLTLRLQSPPPASLVTTVSGSNVTFLSATQFTAQITVGTAAGSWGALVTNPDGTQSSVFDFTASGTGPIPTITSIVTTYGNEASQSAQIAQNAWIEVHGANLAQGAPLTWSGADFTQGLPTTLGGVTATVDGKPAAISYVSPTQVNILSPLDNATGTVSVQLDTPFGLTALTATTEVQASPAFLVFDVHGHVAAEHLPSYALLGPTSLDAPGYTFTPASPGESVTIYATGFGQTSPAFTNQLTNTGLPNADPFPLNLPAPLPTVTIGNLPATVSFAGLVGPGLYQINLTVPASAPAGDLPIVAIYNGSSTQSTAVITVQ
jgi:uncharacterized protein (TIGR03437 family)